MGLRVFIVFGVGLAVVLRYGSIWVSDDHWTIVVIVLAIGVGVGVLGILVASVGMIATAPKDGKRGRTRIDDEPTEPRWRL